MRSTLTWSILTLWLSVGEAGAEPVEATVAGTTFPNTSGEQQWLGFERNVKRLGGDQFDLKMLIYGQLGSEEKLVSGLRRGRIHFANLSAVVTSTVVAEMALLYAPYLFDSYAEADFVYDRYLTSLYRGMLAERGLHFVAWNEIGFYHVYSKTPIILPGDAAGKRFRVSAGRSATLFARSLGADIIPLGFADIVSSLQTGLIEAGENATILYAKTGTAGEAPHFTRTQHCFGMSVIVSPKRWWDALTPEQRSILTEAYPTIESSRQLVRQETEENLQSADELGFSVHDLSSEQLELWRSATAGTGAALAEAIGGRAPEIYATILEGKRAFRLTQPEAEEQ